MAPVAVEVGARVIQIGVVREVSMNGVLAGGHVHSGDRGAEGIGVRVIAFHRIFENLIPVDINVEFNRRKSFSISFEQGLFIFVGQRKNAAAWAGCATSTTSARGSGRRPRLAAPSSRAW